MKMAGRATTTNAGRGASGARLCRTGVFHRVVFSRLLQTALAGQRCLRHAGGYWAPVLTDRGFGIYRPAPDPLACLEGQLEDYEALFYGSLLRDACGRDGLLRPRSRLCRQPSGALRMLDDQGG